MEHSKEEKYIKKRLRKAGVQSILFYVFRIFPMRKQKIVFTTIEGTTGFTCNPKYIALELMRRNDKETKHKKWELVWLVNDPGKVFPDGVRKVKNTLWNRAFHLTTAQVWIDNSRKQLEVRKRKGQVYIQTWHAKLGFKPTCLDRGASFSKIAYLVSKHDSDLVDYWLSNSDWYDSTMKTGSLYEGKMLRTGSPRCDILLCESESIRKEIRQRYGLAESAKIMMYCPTFRGGSQGTDRTVEKGDHFPDYASLLKSLEAKFGGKWVVFLRLHPQLTARHIMLEDLMKDQKSRLLDVSRVDDMYELLAGCDAFMTDYSSAAFDAAIMKIPVFLYCDDYSDYEGERGKLLWDLRELPFPLAENMEELETRIINFDATVYEKQLNSLMNSCGVKEDGHAASAVCDEIERIVDF